MGGCTLTEKYSILASDKLRRALGIITAHCNFWKLKINASKSVYSVFTRRHEEAKQEIRFHHWWCSPSQTRKSSVSWSPVRQTVKHDALYEQFEGQSHMTPWLCPLSHGICTATAVYLLPAKQQSSHLMLSRTSLLDLCVEECEVPQQQHVR